MPDDGGLLYCLDAKDGKIIWEYRYGRGEIRGSPVLADGKIYVGEVSARFHILEPGKKKCKALDEEFFPGAGGVDIELNGTPAVANGRVYFSTAEETLCIGTKAGIAAANVANPAPNAKPGKIAHLQVVPGEIALYPGQSATFKVRAFDADGNFVKEVKPEWSLPAPTPPPGVKANPPALKGEITSDGKLTVDAKMSAQQSIVVATFDGITARARVRVAPQIPYVNDFEKLPDGVVPGGWVNTQGKFRIKTVDGNKVLAKVNDKFSPLISVGNAYITLPTAKDYTIECDVFGTQVVSKEDGKEIIKTPDIGVVANRYTLMFAGNLNPIKLVLTSWDALPRIDKGVNYPWKPSTWYRLKLTTQIADGKGVIKGKAWPRDEKEPADWGVEVTDAYPITDGSAALYGYVRGNSGDVPGTEIYYDNVRITPNKAGGKAAARPAGAELLAVPVSSQAWLELCPDSRGTLLPLLGRLRR
jgi:outer membrane protein assembly factor BamB